MARGRMPSLLKVLVILGQLGEPLERSLERIARVADICASRGPAVAEEAGLRGAAGR